MFIKIIKAFHKNNKERKIYAYENSEGDKGIIIAKSLDEARELFKKEYPKRKIAKNDEEYYDNGSYVFEVDVLENESKLYCPFPW